MGKKLDIVGVSEAAAILGWDRRKLATYIKRGGFPKPRAQLACGQIWERKQIEEYKKKRESN
jgi:predicted DNA-binding transcriptional regulator AlpA